MNPGVNYRKSQSAARIYQQIADGLGWFSVALGAAEIVIPERLATLGGIRDRASARKLLQSVWFGPREIAAGIGILTERKPAGWIWGRFAGDLVDIGLIGAALTKRKNNRGLLSGALVSVLGITALDYVCAQRLGRIDGYGLGARGAKRNQAWHLSRSIWVNKPAAEAYSYWRKFDNLPRFMQHLESVEDLGEGKSRWRANGLLGKNFEWDARIEEEQPNRLISWRSLDGADVVNAGKISFETGPGGRGAMVRVELDYEPPAGSLGSGLAKLFGKAPHQMLEDDLRAFKQIIETGDIIRSDASVHSRMHAARPSEATPARNEAQLHTANSREETAS